MARRTFMGSALVACGIWVAAGGGCGCGGRGGEGLAPPVRHDVPPPPRPPFSSAGASPRVDAIRYTLDLRADESHAGAETYTATVTAELVATTPLGELTLDLEGNTVDAVQLDGGPARWERRGAVLAIALPHEVAAGTALTARIAYHGAFTQGDGLRGADLSVANGMFAFAPRGPRGRIYSGFSWPWGTRRWMPVRDHPSDGALIAMRLTFPASYEVLANGQRGAVTRNADGTKTWEYATDHPIPTYDFHFAAYDHWVHWAETAPHTGVAADFYVYPAHRQAATTVFRDIPAAVDFFSDFVGPYRWGPLRFHEAPNFAFGQENVTVIAIDEGFFGDPEHSVRLCVHELAHQWSGNLLRVATWNDLWLSEGMTEYLTQRFIEAHDTPARARTEWHELLRLGLDAERVVAGLPRAVRPAGSDASPDNLLDGITYRKGAWVLRMLERHVGRERFTAFLHGWFARHAFEAVSTEQFRTELEASVGEDLAGFFGEWVSGPYHPELAVEWRYDPAARAVDVRVEQRQTLGPAGGFTLPTPLDIELSGGNERLRATMEVRGRRSESHVPVPFVPRALDVDPDELLYLEQLCGPHRSCRDGYRCRDGHGASAPVCFPR